MMTEVISTSATGALPNLRPEAAAAALLIKAAAIDGHYTEVDKDTARAALMKMFRLSGKQACDLLNAAEDADADAIGADALAGPLAEIDPARREALVTHAMALVSAQNGAMRVRAFADDLATATGVPFERVLKLGPSRAAPETEAPGDEDAPTDTAVIAG